MDCPKDHLSLPTNLLGISQFGGWSSCQVGDKRRLSSHPDGSVHGHPEVFKPQRDWPGRWVLTGPQEGLQDGRELRAPEAGTLPVAPAKVRSPAP